MKERNYDEFDYLRILVKADLFEEIMRSYACFGWEIDEKSESSIFLDTHEVVLKRKHKLKNKDKLQLFQVYVENDYSALGKLIKNKYAKSTAMGLTVGIIATLFICFFINLAIKTNMVAGLVLGIIMAFLGSLVLVRLFFALSELKKIEDKSYEKRRQQIIGEIEKICLETKKLTEGESDGKN